MNENDIQEIYAPTLCALNSYISIGLFSREFGVRNCFEKLKQVKEEYNNASNEEKEKLKEKVEITKLLVYRELFEKTFLSLEDLAAIVSALVKDLKDFHIEVSKEPTILKALSKITKEKVYKMLKYKDISSYDKEDREYIQEKRDEVVKSIQNMCAYICEFFKKNKMAYMRMKHGNSLLYSTSKCSVDGEEYFVLPVEYNPKNIDHVDILIFNEAICKKILKLFWYIQDFSRLLCEINRQYIECGCYEDPIGTLLLDEEKEQEKIDMLRKKYWNHDMKKYNCNTQSLLTCNKKKIKNIINFYNSLNL